MFDVQEKPVALPEKISVLFVTPQNESADQLSALLHRSRVSIEVEWVNAADGQFERVRKRLELRSPAAPSIVLLDYQTCGPAIWPFIASCVKAMPLHKTEWIVSNYIGSPPVLADFPWRRVTLMGDRFVSN